MNERALRILAPAFVLTLGVVLWDLIVRINGIPPYILPSPGLVLTTLIADWPILWSSLLATLRPSSKSAIPRGSPASISRAARPVSAVMRLWSSSIVATTRSASANSEEAAKASTTLESALLRE